MKKFNPLIFLASLGAGGIAVMPFAFLQYTFQTEKGLITFQQINHSSLPLQQQLLFYLMEGVMIIFTIIHFYLLFHYGRKLINYLKTDHFKEVFSDPLKNSSILAPFIAISMSLNVFIGVVRFFVPAIQNSFQNLMAPALIVWGIIWVALMVVELKLLKISFVNSFDINKISFGWLLHPFALGMITVSGMGIAAMAKSHDIAHIAAFMSLISGTMGFFLFIVKLIAIFKSHFAAKGLPEKQFLPSFLIVLPNLTLYAISAFRFGHYLEHHFAVELKGYFILSIAIPFAFATWYLLFGLTLLSDYFKKHFFTGEFYISLWAFICPFVAYSVLGAFFYKLFLPTSFIYALSILSMITAITFYFMVSVRQLKCKKIIKKRETYNCA